MWIHHWFLVSHSSVLRCPNWLKSWETNIESRRRICSVHTIGFHETLLRPWWHTLFHWWNWYFNFCLCAGSALCESVRRVLGGASEWKTRITPTSSSKSQFEATKGEGDMHQCQRKRKKGINVEENMEGSPWKKKERYLPTLFIQHLKEGRCTSHPLFTQEKCKVYSLLSLNLLGGNNTPKVPGVASNSLKPNEVSDKVHQAFNVKKVLLRRQPKHSGMCISFFVF